MAGDPLIQNVILTWNKSRRACGRTRDQRSSVHTSWGRNWDGPQTQISGRKPSRRVPGTPLGRENGTPNRSREPPGAPPSVGNPQVSPKLAKLMPKVGRKSASWTHLGPGRDPKIDQKRARGEKVGPGSRLSSSFMADTRERRFRDRFWIRFGGSGPLGKHGVGGVSSTSPLFEKVTKKGASGTPFWSPGAPKINQRWVQNRPKCRKT